MAKKKKEISVSEFIFWLIFWVLVVILVINLKRIDQIVSQLGFSASGIEILLYLGIAACFSFIFRLRLKIERIEKDITKLTRELTLKNKEKE